MNLQSPQRPPNDGERLRALLADRAVFGLDPEDQAELDALLSANDIDASGDVGGYEQTAAAFFVAGAGVEVEAMPASVRDRIVAGAASFDFEAAKQRAAQSTAPKATTVSRVDVPAPVARRGRRDWSAGALMAVAAAALLAIGLGLLREPQSVSPRVARAALLAEVDDAVTIRWVDPGADAENGGAADLGDVVWSDARQTGFMRFRALPTNDPTVEQYQLWVFDAERDDRYPVDGGVFDITSGESNADGREWIVPIDAKLPVAEATMFAITIEKPGGVVVSDRSRLPLLAQR